MKQIESDMGGRSVKHKKRNIRKWVVIIFVLVVMIFFSTRGMNEKVPVSEQAYIDTVLSQITTQSQMTDVVHLLGEPSKNMGLKTNWWVEIKGKQSRVTVYFSETTGCATEIILSGGPGRFYYRKAIES